MSGYIARKTLVHTTEMLVRRAKFLSHCERTIATSETLSGVFRIVRLSSWQSAQLVGLIASWYPISKTFFSAGLDVHGILLISVLIGGV